ncbi:SDR family oxidoreductase [Micromonospora yasonensis]|uniref:SDR family oxidoreductase n=1 Tax=Micromonospora yasonensis TaxID=1128667 RepID=UPI002232668A|nr:SDR family oxidoreductase [Micromonospora yasonensis]MCW3840298.1 SDR family oxidoreductase [Micromonospora yasonensis]
MRATGRTEDEAVAAGDEVAFARVTERHRGELRVHCYRMLGSYDESEDLVQETFLRAWRRRETWQGRASLRAWLYRIATNACLDHLERQSRRPAGSAGVPPLVAVPWLQPYPDRLLELVSAGSPLGRALTVAEVAEVAAFLASDRASGMTGTVANVSGGAVPD